MKQIQTLRLDRIGNIQRFRVGECLGTAKFDSVDGTVNKVGSGPEIEPPT